MVVGSKRDRNRLGLLEKGQTRIERKEQKKIGAVINYYMDRKEMKLLGQGLPWIEEWRLEKIGALVNYKK